MGEAKRRKQILGDTYGTSATVKQAIQIAKKKNDALLPSTFIPDFGLEVSAQIGEEPFHFTALELKDLKVIEDAKFGRLAINFIPLQFSITHVNGAANLPIIMRETMITLEIYTPEQSQVDAVIEALSSGIDVKANWSKRFFTAHPVHKELVVPIHILDFGQKGKFADNLREQKLRHHKFPQLFFKLNETELNASSLRKFTRRFVY